MALFSLILQAAIIINLDSLYSNIQSAIRQDEILQEHLYHLVEYWSLKIFRLLLKNRKIHILQKDDFYICILQ